MLPPGHQIIETGLFKLGAATGDGRAVARYVRGLPLPDAPIDVERRDSLLAGISVLRTTAMASDRA